ncbi:MAG TPA: hypothetical protein VIW45_13155 [Vicinamibacterales bacterium]|jgi:hypothetical protein
MTKFLTAVLSVIAVGVLLIAYGLLAPRAAAAPIDNGGGIVTLDPNRYPTYAAAQPTYAGERVVYVPQTAAAERTVYLTRPASTPRHIAAARIDRGRDWKKTALVVGGSTAAGAGIGGAFGGKTGALAGAAIGGGVSSLWEALHR